jgi:hypothetical protein
MKTIDMTTGSPSKKILLFSLPINANIRIPNSVQIRIPNFYH